VDQGALAEPRRLAKEDTDGGAVGDRFGIHVLSRGGRCP
jgi:hypothetical protein